MTQNDTKKLTTKQRKAIEAILSEPTLTAAAKAAGCARVSIYRWMQDDNFKSVLAKAESEALLNLSRGLLSLSEKLLNTLKRKLSSEDENVQLRAVALILTHLPKLRDLSSIEERLAEIEEKLGGLDNGKQG